MTQYSERHDGDTLNPFATGSSDGLTQLVVSLMDEVGDGAMWKGRATVMLTGIMRALTWLRDGELLDLDAGAVRQFMSLGKMMALARHPDLPPHIRISVRGYLMSLPGYSEAKGEKQAQRTLDHHNYLEMLCAVALGKMAHVCGRILRTGHGETDMHGVTLSRRPLIVMLPVLGGADHEIADFERIVVATLKCMGGNKPEIDYLAIAAEVAAR